MNEALKSNDAAEEDELDNFFYFIKGQETLRLKFPELHKYRIT